jgi:hypothetical protein
MQNDDTTQRPAEPTRDIIPVSSDDKLRNHPEN